MIEKIFRVKYRDSVGYAKTIEEAKELEQHFKCRYNETPITSSTRYYIPEDEEEAQVTW